MEREGERERERGEKGGKEKQPYMHNQLLKTNCNGIPTLMAVVQEGDTLPLLLFGKEMTDDTAYILRRGTPHYQSRSPKHRHHGKNNP